MLTFSGRRGASISAARTGRMLVENAGPPLLARRIAFELWRAPGHGGVQRVGRADVTWVVCADGVIGVGHAPQGVPLVAATDALVYAVELVRAKTPTGGVRRWWRCPGCGRRCAALYLPPGRERLGCRTCCRLLYRSQYPPLKRKRRKPA